MIVEWCTMVLLDSINYLVLWLLAAEDEDEDEDFF